ncbi:MAG: hypothetical protein PHR77_20990 [Kiritimatiellae bacterium]|nr:hypothetical protein [Kiritimatiellia bacterium]MDD5519968.1 hypothetical protein [Kiritimatiellia bacterium]
MKKTTYRHDKSDNRKVAVGLLNTQNLLTVYWVLATQPDLFSRVHLRHPGHLRQK